MVAKTFTVNASTKVPTTEHLSLTTETNISLFVFSDSGTHRNRRIGLEASPNNADWVRVGETLKGDGCVSTSCSAMEVRPYVSEAEGQESKAKVVIVAK